MAKYKYVGPEGRHRQFDESKKRAVVLQTGDVVELTEQQAAAFADRFEKASGGSSAPAPPRPQRIAGTEE